MGAKEIAVVSVEPAISLASRSYAEARLGHIDREKESRGGARNVTDRDAITRERAGKLHARSGTLFATGHSSRPAVSYGSPELEDDEDDDRSSRERRERLVASTKACTLSGTVCAI